MENDLPAESRDEGKIVNVSIYGGNYNENIHGDYQQNSLDYQAAILQRTLNLRSPYKGLKRFNARDKDLFFGRQKLIDELIEAVNQTNLVLVLGASGSGKSSVVRAGVMPQIESSPDQSCLFTPYRNPFESFYRSLLNPEKNYGMDDAELEFILQGNHDSFEKAIALLQTKQSEWLIFIDQFEELFTLCPNRETRGNFIQGLINLSQDSNHSVKFILAMRSDFLQELATYPQFSRIASLNIHLVADLEEGELRQAIEQPAAQHGVVLEAGLAEEIIRDVRGQAGSLPLLQYTLDLLWQREDMSDRTLNIATYHQLGGVTGALQKHVNEIYQGLPDEQQLATKQILLRLVDVVALEQSEVQRIAVSKRADKSEFTDIQAETVQFLINKSLLVSDDLNQEGSTVEIAHEALLNSWAELKEWINDARNTISLNNRLLEDASRWQELKNQNSPQANDELWSGSKLEKAVELKKDGTFEVVLGGLSDPVNDFIDASIDWRDRERKEKLAAAERLAKANRIAREAAEKLVKESKARLAAEAKARKEAEQAKTEAENAALEAENARKLQEKLKREAQEKVFLEANSNKKLRRRALGLGIISFTAVILGILAFYLNSKSQEEAEAARLEQRAANIKVKLSLGNEIEHLLESLELVGDNQKFNRKWFKLSTNLFPEVQSVLFQAVEESRETSILNGHEDSVLSLSYSPNGKYLVTGSSDRMVRLWDVSSQSLIHTFDGHEDWVMSVDFSHDSKYIASASKDKKVKLWDVKNPKTPIQTFSGHTDVVMSVDFSHDSKYLVSASHDKKVKLWDVAKPEQPIHTFDGHTDVVMSVGFSHDSKYLVSGGLDKKVKLWDVAKPEQPIHTFDGHLGAVNSVGFSHDSKYLVSGSKDKTVKLWDVANKSLIRTFISHQSEVRSVDFSSDDNRYLVSGSYDRTIKLWDVKNKSLIHTFYGHQDSVRSVGFSTDNKHIVSAGLDRKVRLWDVSSRSLFHNFHDHKKPVYSTDFSSDGNYLASGSYDTTVKLWDVKNPQKPIHTFSGHNKPVFSVGFSPDGNYLASGSYDTTVKLWDVENPQKPIHTFSGHKDKVMSVGFSHDSKYLISGSLDNTVKLWDVENTQKPIHTFNGHQSGVRSVDFSHDSKYLISGSLDNTVKLWDVENTQKPIHTFNGHQSGVRSVDFSHDSKYLVSGSNDRTVKLWDVKNKSLIHTFNGHQSGVRSVGFTHDGNYIVSGSHDKTVKLWDVKNKSLIHTFNGHQSEVRTVDFTHDGNYIASGSDDTTIKLWREINWQSWLSIGCQRIRLHPMLASVEREAAAATCLDYVDFTEEEQAEFLVKQGLAFAVETADYKEAKDKFKQAQKLKPDIDLNPNTEVIENNANTVASQLAAPSKVQQGVNLAKEGKIEEALSAVFEAQKLYPSLKIEAQSWHNLCWFGSINHQAQKVLVACEQAVELAPDAESKTVYLEGRGLARGLTGDIQGAIKDFQVFINSSESNQESLNKRKQWIESLSTGQNPFTDKVLEELKNEKHSYI